jgi:hypothetical protein
MSIKLNIQCEDKYEANIYLNAKQYLNLLTDIQNQIRDCLKYEQNMNDTMNNIYKDICQCTEHHLGPY